MPKSLNHKLEKKVLKHRYITIYISLLLAVTNVHKFHCQQLFQKIYLLKGLKDPTGDGGGKVAIFSPSQMQDTNVQSPIHGFTCCTCLKKKQLFFFFKVTCKNYCCPDQTMADTRCHTCFVSRRVNYVFRYPPEANNKVGGNGTR